MLYDFLHTRGGAERVTVELARATPGMEMCFGYCNGEEFPQAELHGIRCHDLGTLGSVRGLRDMRTMRAFAGPATRFIADYDWALFSGAMAPLAVRHRSGMRNFYYCHTPPRFVYDLREHYLQQLAPVMRPLLRSYIEHLKPRYEEALAAMDVVIANSRNVRERLRRYLNLEARVIYPPVDTQRFAWREQGDYFVSLARHEELKRVDRLVKAFRSMPSQTLVVASGGSQTGRLRQLADGAANIHFTSWLSDDELARLVGGARAALYIPKDEDFGISPVESMAAGKPVIGVAEGGLLETMVHGETGWLLPPDPGVEQVVEAVLRMDRQTAHAMRRPAEQRARLFTRERFFEQMRRVVQPA